MWDITMGSILVDFFEAFVSYWYTILQYSWEKKFTFDVPWYPMSQPFRRLSCETLWPWAIPHHDMTLTTACQRICFDFFSKRLDDLFLRCLLCLVEPFDPSWRGQCLSHSQDSLQCDAQLHHIHYWGRVQVWVPWRHVILNQRISLKHDPGTFTFCCQAIFVQLWK